MRALRLTDTHLSEPGDRLFRIDLSANYQRVLEFAREENLDEVATLVSSLSRVLEQFRIAQRKDEHPVILMHHPPRDMGAHNLDRQVALEAVHKTRDFFAATERLPCVRRVIFDEKSKQISSEHIVIEA